VDQGFIAEEEKDEIVSNAAKSDKAKRVRNIFLLVSY